MMALPDVYCLFNRARGTELISPDDLLQVLAAPRATGFAVPYTLAREVHRTMTVLYMVAAARRHSKRRRSRLDRNFHADGAWMSLDLTGSSAGCAKCREAPDTCHVLPRCDGRI